MMAATDRGSSDGLEGGDADPEDIPQMLSALQRTLEGWGVLSQGPCDRESGLELADMLQLGLEKVAQGEQGQGQGEEGGADEDFPHKGYV
mmetsp:Transcript_31698/g.80645  ORF Transcript_31698/g.80645 Transcript_31698/m.80645 type:complete len:90 (-) Transcript_31698:166-435(-)